MSNENVTMKDVAKHSNVSVATISRYLSGKYVSEPVRKRVENSISELGYKKLKNFQDDKKNKSGIYAIIVPDLDNPFFIGLIKGCKYMVELHEKLLIVEYTNNNPEKEKEKINTLIETGVEGIILVSCATQNVLEPLLASKTPFTILDRRFEATGSENYDYVVSDNDDGAYQATKYLLSLGHSSILYVGGNPNLKTEKERFQGFSRAMEESGIKIDSKLVRYGYYNYNNTYIELEEALKYNKKFTSVFATADIMAYGAYHAIKSSGLKIPENISVIGYDDDPLSSILDLTTISQPAFEMGKNAALFLNNNINSDNKTTDHLIMKPSLVIRNSCARI